MIDNVPDGARPAARVLVIDNGRLLLQKARDSHSGHCWWVAPGGGIEDGETFEQAAIREVEEETGLVVELGPCVWTRHHQYEFEGKHYDQYERFFVARSFTRTTATKPDSYVVDSRWWTLAELQTAGDDLTPRNLASLIGDIFEGRDPVRPLDCGI